MPPTLCPWCHSLGLITQTQSTADGLEVRSRCTVCGSNCHSIYNAHELQTEPLEPVAFVQAGQPNLSVFLLEMLQQ